MNVFVLASLVLPAAAIHVNAPPAGVWKHVATDGEAQDTEEDSQDAVWPPNLKWPSREGQNVDEATQFDKAESKKYILASPQHKLLFCFIPCSADVDTSFNLLFDAMNGMTNLGVARFRSSALHGFEWTESFLDQVMQNSSWTKAVFMRDPVERLLTGFMSMCSRHDSDTKDCALSSATSDTSSLSDFVERLRSEHVSGAGIMDSRFRQQTDFCGGFVPNRFDFVGTFDSDLGMQVNSMLQMVDVHQERLVAELFPSFNGSDANASAYNFHFSTARLLSQVRELYEKDIAVLGRRRSKSKICLTAASALDLEKYRILEWVAYHTLIGVECFMLFVDHGRSNMSDADVKTVYHRLASLRSVMLFQIEDIADRIPDPTTMANLMDHAGARFLAPVDTDELLVFRTEKQGSNAKPPSLKDFVRGALKSHPGHTGVYLHRYDFGTSGFKTPPFAANTPGFPLFTQRKPAVGFQGKPILDMSSGTQFIGVHTWQRWGKMLLPDGNSFNCDARCFRPRDSVALTRVGINPWRCPGNCSRRACKDIDEQVLAINHYVTGSFSECLEKYQVTGFRRRSKNECEELHNGAGLVKDAALMSYAKAINDRVIKLFGTPEMQWKKTGTEVAGADLENITN